ncbi:MAG: hypothetical protein IJX55_06415 [Clostridia bacterium]|nr:hypothetical protein [Clostridia bacterium]
MFYLRKLSKKANLLKIKNAVSKNQIDADILKQELGTSSNTLSFWKCENLEHPKDTIKAILLSTTSIDTSQFIIFSDELLEKYHIETDDSQKGTTGYKGYETLHVNLCNLNYEKIGIVLDMIKEIADKKEFTPELKKEEVKRYISEVREDGLLDETNIREELKEAINKYCVKIA